MIFEKILHGNAVRPTRTHPTVEDTLWVGTEVEPFRGLQAEKYTYWVEQLGRNGKGLSVTKTHRFTEEDLEKIEILKTRWSLDETATLRKALILALQNHLD